MDKTDLRKKLKEKINKSKINRLSDNYKMNIIEKDKKNVDNSENNTENKMDDGENIQHTTNDYLDQILDDIQKSEYTNDTIDIYKNKLMNIDVLKLYINMIKKLHDKFHHTYIDNRDLVYEQTMNFMLNFILKHFKPSIERKRKLNKFNRCKHTDLNNIKSKCKINNVILLHIPKTGGTSLFSALSSPISNGIYTIDNFYTNSFDYNEKYNFYLFFSDIIRLSTTKNIREWIAIPENAISGKMYKNFDYFIKYKNESFNHIHLSLYDMVSNSDVIINNIDYFAENNYKILIMLRDPIKRLKSEYKFFYKHRLSNPYSILMKYVFSNLENDFKSYIYNSNCHNYQIGFLYGFQWQTDYIINEQHLENLKKLIDKNILHFGILEYLEETEIYFSHILNEDIKIPSKNQQKKDLDINVNLDENDIKYLIKKNKYDYDLYNYALNHMYDYIIDNIYIDDTNNIKYS